MFVWLDCFAHPAFHRIQNRPAAFPMLSASSDFARRLRLSLHDGTAMLSNSRTKNGNHPTEDAGKRRKGTTNFPDCVLFPKKYLFPNQVSHSLNSLSNLQS